MLCRKAEKKALFFDSHSLHRGGSYRSLQSSGFTLVEILVSIGILAAMMFSILQISTGISTAREKSEAKSNLQHSVILVLTKFSDDLRTAFQADKKFWGKDNNYTTGFLGDETSINFSTMSNVHRVEDHHDTDQIVVGYYLETTDEGNYRLMRRSTDYLVDDLEEGGESFVLLQGVKSLTFSYYDSNKEEWVEQWDTSSVLGLGRLPREVKIRLVMASHKPDIEASEEERKYTFELVVPIEMHDKKISF